jgi:hypothetical protein
MSFLFFTRKKCSMGFRFFRLHALAKNSSTDIASLKITVALCKQQADTHTHISALYPITPGGDDGETGMKMRAEKLDQKFDTALTEA